jgi:hypothetical protein
VNYCTYFASGSGQDFVQTTGLRRKDPLTIENRFKEKLTNELKSKYKQDNQGNLAKDAQGRYIKRDDDTGKHAWDSLVTVDDSSKLKNKLQKNKIYKYVVTKAGKIILITDEKLDHTLAVDGDDVQVAGHITVDENGTVIYDVISHHYHISWYQADYAFANQARDAFGSGAQWKKDLHKP